MVRMAENAGHCIGRYAKRLDPGNAAALDLDPITDAEARIPLQRMLNDALVRRLRQAALHKLGQGDRLRHCLYHDDGLRRRLEQLCPDCQDGFCALYPIKAAQNCKILLIQQERRRDLQIPEVICIIISRSGPPDSFAGIHEAEIGDQRNHPDHNDGDPGDDLLLHIAEGICKLRSCHAFTISTLLRRAGAN